MSITGHIISEKNIIDKSEQILIRDFELNYSDKVTFTYANTKNKKIIKIHKQRV